MKFFVSIFFFVFIYANAGFAQTLEADLDKIIQNEEKGVAARNNDFLQLEKKYSPDLANFPDDATLLYFNWGNTLYASGQTDEAVQQFTKAYNYALAAKDTSLKYIVIHVFAKISSNLGNYIKAEEYYQYCLYGLAALYGQSSLEYTMIFFEYVRVLVHLEKYSDAKPLLSQLVNYFQVLKMENHPTYLAVLSNLAYIYNEEGEYEKAIELNEFLLQDNRLLKSGDTLNHVIITGNLGEVYREMGMYERALNLQLTTRRMFVQFNITNPEHLANNENNIGLIYKSLNDYEKSEEHFDNAILIYKKNNMTQAEEYCSALSNKADLLRLLSRREEALKLLNEAIQIRKSVYGTDSENYANALSTYGLILFENYNLNEALNYFEEAKAIYERNISGTHQSYANCLNNLSACYAELNQAEKAMIMKEQALSIIEKNLGKEHFKYISFTISSWHLYVQLHKIEKGIALLTEAKALALKKFGQNHHLYQSACTNLSILYFHLGNYEKGLDLLVHALDLKVKNINTYFYTMNRANQLAYLEDLNSAISQYVICLMNYIEYNPSVKTDIYNEKLMNYQLLIKSLLNKSSANWMKQLASSNDPVLKSEYQQWIKFRNTLSELYKFDFTVEEEQKLIEEINSLETRLRKKANATSDKLYTSKDIQLSLKDGEVAIEILRYYYVTNPDSIQEKYVALCINSKSPKPYLILLNDAQFNADSALWYYAYAMENQLQDAKSFKRFGWNLYDNLKNEKKWYVSAQGAYSGVNLATLYNPDENNYLQDRVEISFVSNLTAIGYKSGTSTIKTADIFGNPDFYFDFRKNIKTTKNENSNMFAKRFGLSNLEELPGTEKEIKEINTVLSDAGWKVYIFNREKASEENVRNVQSPTVLHIATHGYFLQKAVAGDTKFLGFSANAFSEQIDLKSGLILAGASISTQDSVKVSALNDGILTAGEASQINLVNTELVVLSACQTGLGFDLGNQGVSGLQQALSSAGAKNILMSLWPVDDEATQLLMVHFYKNWISGAQKNIDVAFQHAQSEVKKKYPHPYYWGAFVLMKN